MDHFSGPGRTVICVCVCVCVCVSITFEINDLWPRFCLLFYLDVAISEIKVIVSVTGENIDQCDLK